MQLDEYLGRNDDFRVPLSTCCAMLWAWCTAVLPVPLTRGWQCSSLLPEKQSFIKSRVTTKECLWSLEHWSPRDKKDIKYISMLSLIYFSFTGNQVEIVLEKGDTQQYLRTRLHAKQSMHFCQWNTVLTGSILTVTLLHWFSPQTIWLFVLV